MQPSHANKSGRRYRYYVTASDLVTLDAPATRLPSHDIEEVVRDRLCSFLSSKTELRRELMVEEAVELGRIAARSAELVSSFVKARQIRPLLERIDLSDSSVLLTISRSALASLLNLACDEDAAPIMLSAPAVKVRHGKEVRMVLDDGSAGSDGTRNPHLVALLAEASEAKQLIDRSAELSITQIAERAGRCRAYLTKLYRVAHLAPDIAELIMRGQQPGNLSTRMLLNTRFPLAWQDQRSLLAIG
jgi:hypothetical protein